MSIEKEEEILDLFDRLQERLHQTVGGQGCHIEFVYVAAGAQHIGNIENQNFCHGDTMKEETGVPEEQTDSKPQERKRKEEELCHFIHPALEDGQGWLIHDEVKRLLARHGVQEICQYLMKLRCEGKLLLPQRADVAYAELARMGMPDGDGFNIKTFRKYYKNK